MKYISSLLASAVPFFLFLFVSCAPQSEKSSASQPGAGSSIKHAQFFDIQETEAYTLVTVFNPWTNKGDILQQYALLPKNTENPTGIPPSAIQISTPIPNIATTSATHVGYLEELGLTDQISGHSQFNYLYNATLKQRRDAGKVVELGNDQNMNVEKVVELHPAVLMATIFNEISPAFKLIEKTGIPIAYNMEWKETSPLARAEWIKFVAVFFDQLPYATQLFNEIESNYKATMASLPTNYSKTKILNGVQYRGTWYIPGGNSYMAQLIKDAGGTFAWENDTTTGSLPLSIESVLDKSKDADVWINPDGLYTMEAILDNDERNALFDVYKTGRIFNPIKRRSENGGLDYWESGMVNPHLILKDFVQIFHNPMVSEDSLYFYARVK